MSLSLISDLCGIAGFLMSLFAIGAVIRINKKINSNNVIVKNSTLNGEFTGRDKNTNNVNA